MKAAIVGRGHGIEIREVPSPVPGSPGELVADVLYVGICRTDVALRSAPESRGLILGHEAVLRIPGEPGLYALNNEIACGRCDYCAEGLTSHCAMLLELGVNRHGAYAERLAVHRTNLHPIVVSLPALGVLAEPLSCAIRGVERLLATLPPLGQGRTRALIIGAGISGQLIAFLLRRRGFPGELRYVDRPGVRSAVLPGLDCQVLDRPETAAFHLAIECSGTEAGARIALDSVRNAGVVCLYGVPPAEGSWRARELFRRELAIITSFAGSNAESVTQAIRYIEDEPRFFAQLLGRRVQLDALDHELSHWDPLPCTRTVVTLGGP
jgi:L-iditol 2-dehydrogenase